MDSPQVLLQINEPFFFVALFFFNIKFLCFWMFVLENLVGKGGYAEVYRGILSNGEEIAVKRLTKISTDERKEKEFLTEIGTIGHVQHQNVVSLLGCCLDNGLYLIFHFSSRGSVASLLHGRHQKTNQKLKILLSHFPNGLKF